MHIQILVAVVAMAALGASSAQEESPCETSCGNLTIRFPFGSLVGCYYSSDFLVTCDRSSGEPIPLFGSDLVILNMSPSKSELEVEMFIASDCYNTSGRIRRSRPFVRMGDIRISTKSRFVAIGCVQ